MKEKILTLLLCIALTADGVYAQNIGRHTVDSLLKLLPDLSASTTGAGVALKIANFYIDKPGSLKADLDSAIFFINEAKKLHPGFNSPWTDGYILFVEGRLADEDGKSDERIPLITKAIKCIQRTRDTLLLGRAYYELSRCYPDYTNEAQLAIRISLIEKALILLRRSPNQIDLAGNMQMLCDLFAQQGQFSKSLDEGRLTLNLLKLLHQQSQGMYIIMSTDELWLGNYQQALTYGLLAITASEQVQEKSGPQRLQIENVVASCYRYLDDVPKSIEHYKLAMSIAIENRDTSNTYTMMESLCRAYLASSQPQQAIVLLNKMINKYPKSEIPQFKYIDQGIYLQGYLQLKSYKKATEYYNYCRSWLSNPPVQDQGKGHIYMVLASYEEALGKFDAAYTDLRIYAKYAEKYHNNFNREIGYGEHAKLDSLTHNYKSAYFYTIRYRKLSDSLLNLNKNKQIQELEVVYKIRQKDNSIELLHQKAKVQEAELSKSRRITDETLAGIFILVGSGGFFLRQYRIRQKAFRIIGKQNGLILQKSDEIDFKNKELQGLIQEKEYLLMEVHHRVKNNLHTVLSFLSLQARYLTGDALEAIKISRQRIYAMSLIHQKLYLADDVKTIDIKSYLDEFVSYFKDCLSPDAQINFIMKVEAVRLPVTRAIPIGLIVNEAITNSAKYAFPDNREGVIFIKLVQQNEIIELVITDDGIGMSENVNLCEFDSLGIKLIKGLTNDIGGSIIFDSSAGMSLHIKFSVES